MVDAEVPWGKVKHIFAYLIPLGNLRGNLKRLRFLDSYSTTLSLLAIPSGMDCFTILLRLLGIDSVGFLLLDFEKIIFKGQNLSYLFAGWIGVK